MTSLTSEQAAQLVLNADTGEVSPWCRVVFDNTLVTVLQHDAFLTNVWIF